MIFTDTIFTASQSLRRNPSRSLLTILGIVIGIAAVIIMLSIGQGAQRYILDQVSSLGSDQMFVQSGSGDSQGGGNPYIAQTLTMKDVAALETNNRFTAVSPVLMSNEAVKNSDGDVVHADVMGVTPDNLLVQPSEVVDGRFVDDDDVAGGSRVAVLGSEIAATLFPNSEPVGQTIKLRTTSFRIIGVQAPQGTQFFSNLDNQVLLPITTMQHELLGVDYVNYIALRAPGDIDDAKDEARFVLRDSHNIDNSNGDLSLDDFQISSQADAIQIIGVVGSVLSALLASIAAISLIVGGIGIMNIMLVSVTERTREIGLRKAIGATYREILQQFLVESILLTLAGGILGILLGVGVTLLQGVIVRHFIAGWSPTVPLFAIILSVVVSSAVGLIFGIYPARSAAKLDPIEALRYE
jgi:putative ABC transport system permease protein